MTFCLGLKWLISGKKQACCPWQPHTMHLRISRGDKMTAASRIFLHADIIT